MTKHFQLGQAYYTRDGVMIGKVVEIESGLLPDTERARLQVSDTSSCWYGSASVLGEEPSILTRKQLRQRNIPRSGSGLRILPRPEAPVTIPLAVGNRIFDCGLFKGYVEEARDFGSYSNGTASFYVKTSQACWLTQNNFADGATIGQRNNANSKLKLSGAT